MMAKMRTHIYLAILMIINFTTKSTTGFKCEFNPSATCQWQIDGNSIIASSLNGTNDSNTKGSFIVFKPLLKDEERGSVIATLKSPILTYSDLQKTSCSLIFDWNTGDFESGSLKVILYPDEKPDFEIKTIKGNNLKTWKRNSTPIGQVQSETFKVVIEIESDRTKPLNKNAYVAIDNLTLDNCFEENNQKSIQNNKSCFYKCISSDKCISRDQICDIIKDCPQGDDEQQSCDELPHGSYCSFDEYDFCLWTNVEKTKEGDGEWIHEFENNEWYLSARFPPKSKFGYYSSIKSALFKPIPFYHSQKDSSYFNSCHVRFLYLMAASGSEIRLVLNEKNPRYHETGREVELWREFITSSVHKTGSISWTRVSIALPHNISHDFELEFSASIGFRGMGTGSRNRQIIALDSISLSKECFGIGVPESEIRVLTPAFIPEPGLPFAIPTNNTIKSFRLSSCGANGRIGPTYRECESFYANTSTRAAVIENSSSPLNGTQMWTVPQTAYYTIFVRGAKGGDGLVAHSSGGNGALVRGVFKFQEGDTIFALVGQSGTDACRSDLPSKLKKVCQQKRRSRRNISQLSSILNEDNFGGAGGGGGGTYVFKLEEQSPHKLLPLLIAGGGGGGGSSGGVDKKSIKGKNGRGFDFSNTGTAGNGDESGGGWNSNVLMHKITSGSSLMDGGYGGYVCDEASQWRTNGGFGGGGGGCANGGGGGGYKGGDSYEKGYGGQGGTSFVNSNLAHLQLFSDNSKRLFNDSESNGEVVIVPQIENCCNDGLYACVIVGQSLSEELNIQCICSHDTFQPQKCSNEFIPSYTLIIMLSITFILIFLIVIFGAFIVTRYRKSCNNGNRAGGEPGVRDASASQLLSNSSTDVQLSRLRSGHNIITEYNPNYEFGGSTCTLQDLREIPREKLTLIKALGQGAFGEVYQGLLHNMPGEITDELPVAVKTLPEYSANNQAEMDFLMEALIMSKFKHRNIVRFIGVCFEKMPRFIVLELLPGGDLKTFLRESRGTTNKPSTLVMGDLLVIALDVALGCQYLEENHFIHRDIAARNCLLTNKTKAMTANFNHINNFFNITNYSNGFNNSGIIVKIADFGMARDIYRADYYRKGGKAMLPVKWMPPEAFLDGIFTSKTDVWSFGVLLWEVMSMGYMPYPGRGNQEVMQMVTAGGRLESPNSSTPPQVFAIMIQCWNPIPDQRPSFTTIIERLGYCLQDPDVLNVNLPIFPRAPSMERDMTLMRPPPDATDYLVPNNPCSNSNSNYSMSTEKTELLSPDTCSTFSCTNEDNKLLELLDDVNPPVIPPRTGSWRETSFSDRNSVPKNPANSVIGKSDAINSNLLTNSSPQPLTLDASNLLQQPSRYVNVNVNDSSEPINSNNIRMNTQHINC